MYNSLSILLLLIVNEFPLLLLRIKWKRFEIRSIVWKTSSDIHASSACKICRSFEFLLLAVENVTEWWFWFFVIFPKGYARRTWTSWTSRIKRKESMFPCFFAYFRYHGQLKLKLKWHLDFQCSFKNIKAIL